MSQKYDNESSNVRQAISKANRMARQTHRLAMGAARQNRPGIARSKARMGNAALQQFTSGLESRLTASETERRTKKAMK